MTIDELKPPVIPPVEPRFFQRVDWLSFGLTALLAFTVYWFTLAPEVNLDYSGIYATAAMYPSASFPSGHPLWAIYGWLFVKLIPFSNTAWRVGVASAVAGSLTCGLIALTVSRVGFLIVESLPTLNQRSSRDQNSCRWVCGCVAGLSFAFDGSFWCKTVVADTWPLSLFLFALTISLLARWFFAPHQRRYLYAAAFVHGLTLSESQALVPASFAFLFLLALSDRNLGREIFFVASIFLWLVLLLKHSLEPYGWHIGGTSQNFLMAAVAITAFSWAGVSLSTRTLFSEWKTTCGCAFLFLAGISAYFLLPLFSMTTPPVNWGYARTVEGFSHVLSRGQFEAINPTNSFNRLLMQWQIYFEHASSQFGMIYLIAAISPFLLLHKTSSRVRSWLIGLLTVWFLMSLLMLVGLNVDRSSADPVGPFFAATHLILAMLAGYGLILVGVAFGRPMLAKA